MSGKHGRRRLGRSDEPGNVTTSPGRRPDDPTLSESDTDLEVVAGPDRTTPGLSVETIAPPVLVLTPPAPPTPPSLGPIRSRPLPEFDPALTSLREQATALAAEEAALAAAGAASPLPEYVAPEPVVVAQVAPAPEVTRPPVGVPAADRPPIGVPPALEAMIAAVALADAEAEVDVEVVDEPSLPLLSTDPILPRRRLGSRGTAREERSGRQRRLFLAVVAGVVVIALLAWWMVADLGRSSSKPAPVVAAGRTQTTLLVQLSGGLGVATDSLLVAHDAARHAGVGVLIPSQLVAQVPGFGSMPFGQALSVGDPTAATTALSDLIGVTVDGAWNLTPQAFAGLIDHVGGVTVTVAQDVTKTAADGTTSIVVPAGTGKLNGTEAVAYATFLAAGEPEQARLARFDAVFLQMLAALPKDPAQASTLIGSLGAGSATTFAASRLGAVLTGLAGDASANQMDNEQLPVKELDTGQAQHAFTLDATATAQVVNAQLANSVPAVRKATGNRVYIQNQVGTPGLGESTRLKLQDNGFVYIHGDNTQDMPNATAPSVVLIFGTTAADIAKGDAVAKALGLPLSDVKVSATGGVSVADVAVKLGVDYKQ